DAGAVQSRNCEIESEPRCLARANRDSPMSIVFAILFVFALGFAIFLLLRNKGLETEVLRVQTSADQKVSEIQQTAQASIAEAQNATEERIAAIQQESLASVAEAQKL